MLTVKDSFSSHTVEGMSIFLNIHLGNAGYRNCEWYDSLAKIS